jgi:hypothetical protein
MSVSIIGRVSSRLEEVAKNFTIETLAKDLQPEIRAALKRNNKEGQRQRKLAPLLTVWLILTMPLRRELSYPNLLDWLLSGLRFLGFNISRKPVAEGAITHARKRIGVEVIRDLFEASKKIVSQLQPNFHGLTSLAIDGVGLTMPDTLENFERFGKPGSARGVSAFPQLRVAGLVATATQAIIDVLYGPYCGKGNGERTLGKKLILKNAAAGLLFLLDRGFYGFELLDAIIRKQAAFLIRVPDSAKLRRIPNSTLDDGSYHAWLIGKVEDPTGPWPDGRKRWIEVSYKVRVIEYQIKGFRKTRLATNLLDSVIEARALVRHYHRRWEIELAYDAIKTHQCATRTGQSRTIFRSKLPELVEQELFAMLTLYNLLRDLIKQAAKNHGLDPLAISFVDTLNAVIDAIPLMQRAPPERLRFLYEQLLDDIARCAMKRCRRKRAYPRVVKVKMSNFRLKRSCHEQIFRDFEAETKILGQVRRIA